jgi:hypothetical protein
MIDEIKIMVEEKLKVNFNKNSRKRHYVYSRAVFFMILDRYCSVSTSEMGRAVNRDHATVIHYRKNVYHHARSEHTYINAFKQICRIVEKKLKKTHVADMMHQIRSLEVESERLKRLEVLVPMLSEHLNDKAKKIIKLEERLHKIENDFFFEDHEVRFRALSEENKELFRIRANAILNMMR